MPATDQSFEGLHLGGSCTGGQCGAGWPPDTVGDVGPTNYIEAVNTAVGIYSKTGTQQAAFTFNSLWSGAGSGTPCDTSNQGDPTVVFDAMAGRWFVADFTWSNIDSGPYYECLAVSKTGNPLTGGWWLYAVRADDAAHNWLPDYPKMGIWPDGLYMSANMFDCINSCTGATYKGVRVFAFNRTALEAGAPLQEVYSDLGTSNFSLLPSHLQGAAPPAGSPNYFAAESQSVYGIDVFKFHVDWATPGSSSFTGPTTAIHPSYTQPAQVPQPGTTLTLDSLGERLMMQAQYRNISGAESLWVAHTVGGAPDGVQWLQVDVTGGSISTTPVQQQIWKNVGSDGVSRWMPSLAVDRLGDMAIGYSASSTSLYPSIRYAGRLAGDPLNTLGQGEATLYAGAGSQNTFSRWGDYTSMSVDPVDGCTFWYVGEYYAATGTDWHTRIGSFKFPGCAASADLALTNTDSRDPVRADSTAIYKVHVTNNGPSNATSVVVTDTPPANTIFGSASATQGSCSGTTTVTCNLGGIANGAGVDLTIKLTPITPATISNTAAVAATETDPNTTDNSASQSTTVKAQARTKYVSVIDPGFTPATLAVKQGTTIQWNFFGPSSNSVADSSGLGLFSSGSRAPVSYFRFGYVGAGKYATQDVAHHAGRIDVGLTATPGSGTTATPFTVTWSSASAPAGFVFDVQVKRPGVTWHSWLTGQTAASGIFSPDAGSGNYRFRARMRNLSGGASAYSPSRAISVS